MNTEPDQVEGSAQGQQPSALCERLFRRHSEPIGIIDVREAERLYKRIIGWIAGRYALLEQLMNRYQMDDVSGDGQPFVLEQSFREMINTLSTPMPGGALPSQTLAFPSRNQATSTEARTATPIKTSAAPSLDSSSESSPTTSTKFRVSRRPPPVSSLDQSDDWPSGGAAVQSTEAFHQSDANQSKPAAREDAGSLTFPPLSLHQQMNAEHEAVDTQMPAADAARSVGVKQPSTRQPIEEAPSAKRLPVAQEITIAQAPQAAADVSSPTVREGFVDAPLALADAQATDTVIHSADAAKLASANQTATDQPVEAQSVEEAPPAQRLARAREITSRLADALSPLEPSPLDLAQPAPAQLPESDRQNADQRAADAEREANVSDPISVAALRPASVNQAATEPPIEAQSAEDAQAAKRPAIAREIIRRPTEAIADAASLLLKDDAPTRQTSAPQSTPTAQSDRATESHRPTAATENASAQPDAEKPVQLRSPVSSQDSPALQSVVEINPATRQAQRSEPLEMALTASPAQPAPKAVPSRSRESSSDAVSSGPYLATEMRREMEASQPVDFIWREGDDAAAEIALRQSGVSAPPSAHGFQDSASRPSSSLPDQRAAQPPTEEPSRPVNFDQIPDHVINSISQQVIRALSRLLTVERERKGIR